MNKFTFFVSCLGVLVIPILSLPVKADPVDYTFVLKENMFGNLNQADLRRCGIQNFGCGPTAAANSFVFLEKRYPTLYGGKLIPKQPGRPVDYNNDGKIDFYDNTASVATTLALPNYMNTLENQVTFRYGLMTGKETYIDEKVPNSTIYEGQDSPRLTGQNPRFPKPTYVTRKQPTWEFIRNNLKDMEDVEILISQFNASGQETFGHYLTVTNIKWIDQDMDGIIDQNEGATLGVIDPNGGNFREYSIFQNQRNGIVFLRYGNRLTEISAAVKESPKKKKEETSQPTGQTAAGKSSPSLSFDATTGLLSLTPFPLTSAYVTEDIGFLDINRVDDIFMSDPILGANLSFSPFELAGNIGDDKYLFFHSFEVDNTIKIIKDNDTFLTASVTSLIFDPNLSTPFYARLYDIELNTSLGSAFIDQLQDRLLNSQELPFDLFIKPDFDFLSATNNLTNSANGSANSGLGQNSTPVPEPTSTLSLLALSIIGAASTFKPKKP